MTPSHLYPDLLLAKSLLYEPLGFIFSDVQVEEESKEYSACDFTLNHLKIKFRAAKTTPTKVGQFVTLWKRNTAGITCPCKSTDNIDRYIISARKDHQFGQFVFTKDILIKQEILSTPKKDGKRGFRIYPPWETNLNKQALKTQAWQKEFFIGIGAKELDKDRVSALYGLKTISA